MSSVAIEAAAIPLPRELKTPPVTKIYFVCFIDKFPSKIRTRDYNFLSVIKRLNLNFAYEFHRKIAIISNLQRAFYKKEIFMARNLNFAFGAIFVLFSGYFIFWGLNLIGDANKIVFILAAIFGLFLAFNIGGNDVANSFGTSVGAKTLTITQALCVAAIFEVSGAVIAGADVISTVRNGIVNFGKININPNDFIFIMLSALISAGTWLLIATKKGWPVSTTHAIVGAIVGSSITLGVVIDAPQISAFDLVQWNKIGGIVISWVLSPALGGVASYIVYSLIKHYIIDYNVIAQQKIDDIKTQQKEYKKEYKRSFEALDEIQKIAYTEAMNRDLFTMKDPDFELEDLDSEYYKNMIKFNKEKEKLKSHKALELGIPIIAAIGCSVITSLLLFKGFGHMELNLTLVQNYFIIAMVAMGVWVGFFVFAKTLRRSNLQKSTFLMFSWLQVVTACGFAFSHGSNDIANAVGPFVAIIDTLRSDVVSSANTAYPVIMLAFGVALVVGLWFIGKEVIQTVGSNITQLHPASGFCAELSSAGVVMAASVLGLPVSSTHILIGAIIGIGIANSQTNWAILRPIVMAWIITLPVAAGLSAVCFLVFRNLPFLA